MGHASTAPLAAMLTVVIARRAATKQSRPSAPIKSRLLLRCAPRNDTAYSTRYARNIALAAGAKGDEIDRVAKMMAQEKDVRMNRALALLKEIRD